MNSNTPRGENFDHVRWYRGWSQALARLVRRGVVRLRPDRQRRGTAPASSYDRWSTFADLFRSQETAGHVVRFARLLVVGVVVITAIAGAVLIVHPVIMIAVTGLVRIR